MCIRVADTEEFIQSLVSLLLQQSDMDIAGFYSNLDVCKYIVRAVLNHIYINKTRVYSLDHVDKIHVYTS